jgi:hypothetical protein
MIALYPFGSTSSSIGNQVPLEGAMYWATSCGLETCDGVVADGTVYYRSGFPDKAGGATKQWPLVGGGQSYQLFFIQVNSMGMATVIAESRPFSVSGQCPP